MGLNQIKQLKNTIVYCNSTVTHECMKEKYNVTKTKIHITNEISVHLFLLCTVLPAFNEIST